MDKETAERRKLFTSAAEVAVLHGADRLRIAHNEDDATTDTAGDAAHFLKLDGKRLGRDLELYAFMLKMMGAAALADFIGEIILPLKSAGLAEAHRRAWEDFRAHGRAYVPADSVESWNRLLD